MGSGGLPGEFEVTAAVPLVEVDFDPELAPLLDIAGALVGPRGDSPVGLLRATVLRDAWQYESDDLYQICDAHSKDLADMFRTVDSFLLPLGPFDGLFFLSLVELEPEYRGSGLGLHFVAQALRLFGSDCAYAILQPFPQQFADQPDAVASHAFQSGLEALRRHWARLGFQPVSDFGEMVLNIGRNFEELREAEFPARPLRVFGRADRVDA
ncbi:MAG: hypothetical protein ACSLFM_00300 [Tepidiformaceae bacterium]